MGHGQDAAAGERALDRELASRLNSAAIHLLRRLAREDTALGVSAVRLSALSVLVFGGPRSLGALATAEGVTPATMSRLVAAMVREGLVERSPDERDARAVRIAATERGRAILLQGRQRRVDVLAEMLARRTEAERRSLRRGVELIEALLAADGPSR